MLWQDSGGVTAESVRKQQAEWAVSVLKTKMQAKQMRRKEYNELSFAWRSKFLKNGGKITD